jgi:hypothetical protein
VSDEPLDLDKHRGMAEQKAIDIRRILADVKKTTQRTCEIGRGYSKTSFFRFQPLRGRKQRPRRATS